MPKVFGLNSEVVIKIKDKMSLANLKNHIELLENIQQHSLKKNSPLAQQPSLIKKKLFLHQLAALHQLQEKEKIFQSGFPVSPEENIYSNYGILGEQSGTGKTLTILAHIAQMESQSTQFKRYILNPASSSSFFSTVSEINKPNEILLSSLIVVPHTLYKFWQQTIEQDTTFKNCYFIKTQKDILSSQDDLLKLLQTTPLTLISNTIISPFLTRLKNISNDKKEIYTWKRCIYDEADIIKIPSTCPIPHTRMNWLVTSTPLNFLMFNTHYNTHYLRNLSEDFLQTLSIQVREQVEFLIKQNSSSFIFYILSKGFFKSFIYNRHPLRYHLLISSSKDFLDVSVSFFPPLYQIIKCQQPTSLVRAIPVELHNSLQQENLEPIFQTLGISSFTPETLPNSISEKYSLTQVEKEFCAICCEDQKDPCLIPCCGKLFCSSCILEWMKRLATCPLCRTPCLPQTLFHISNHFVDRKKETLPSRTESFINFLNNNTEKKIIVVTRFDHITLAIDSEIKAPSAFFHGNKDILYSLNQDFNKGSLNILFIDNIVNTAGLSFSSADYIVFLFKYSFQDIQKFIGTVQRIDRKSPLTIVNFQYVS